jgi:hypothetical protein
MLLVAAALGQAPEARGLLDAVPAEADVVVYTRGLAPVRDDLVAMLKAMSPALAAQAEPGLDGFVTQGRAQLGDLIGSPFAVAVRAAQPDAPGQYPVLIVLKAPDYDALVKAVAADKDVKLKHEDGFDSFVNAQGQTWYIGKAGDVVGIGPDKPLFTSFLKAGGKKLAAALSPALRGRLTGGDVGLYVNVAALSARYSEEIVQAKQAMIAGLAQAAQQQPGTATVMDMAKSMYAGLFDSIKEADALALKFDFSAEGATIDGDLTIKADSAAGKFTAGAKSGDATGLDRLPADASFYVYMNVDAKSFESFQKLGIGMFTPGGKPTPELEAALAKQRDMGRVESVSAVTMTNGMRMFNLYKVSNPAALLAASEATMKAMKNSDSPLNFYKDVTVTRDAETYGGFTFTRTEMVVDPEKLEKFTTGNPAQAAQMKAMLGGGKITSWFGLKEGQMLQITAPSWEQAKAQIDAYEKGEGHVGASPGFAAARAKLPKDVNLLMLMSAQGFVRQIAAQLGAGAPTDLPKEPALIGLSLTTTPGTGFEFRVVVPSSVGAVFEKGMPRAAPNP